METFDLLGPKPLTIGAIAEITSYFENEPEVGTPDGDRFDVLATLIETYEDEHYPIEASSSPKPRVWAPRQTG